MSSSAGAYNSQYQRQSMYSNYENGGRNRQSLATPMKARQMSHLHSQLAQLQANMNDLENLLKVTAVQGEYIKRLGGLHGALFIASHRVFEKQALGGTETDHRHGDEQ
ncbi:DASH complex subunit Hsk3 like-domain-containing protein [Dipodascopsis tothii]|uniref:DASH complex subunit Hsk3 like-domain-containing protein n=1 Tax=Dipodascopsis tothii TaxID=44089 RepID=UPI0034CF78DB